MKPWLWAAFGLFLGVASLAELWTALRPSEAPASAEALMAAKAEIQAKMPAGAHFVLSPLLTTAELRPFLELGGRPSAPGDPIWASKPMWVLDRASAPIWTGRPVLAQHALEGGLLLRHLAPLDRGSNRPGFQLVRDFGPDTLRIRTSEGDTPCRAIRGAGGFRCPGMPSWIYAGLVSYRIGGRSEVCFNAHPITDKTVVIELPASGVASASLQLEAAISDSAVNPNSADVRTEVWQGTQRRGELRAENRRGWQKATIAVTPGQSVELRVRTQNDGRRHHCLRAEFAP